MKIFFCDQTPGTVVQTWEFSSFQKNLNQLHAKGKGSVTWSAGLPDINKYQIFSRKNIFQQNFNEWISENITTLE